MLRQTNRFHGHASLKYLFSHGAQARTRYFSVRVVANPRRQHSRAAVIVSKKLLHDAVPRNHARRRIYELLRHHLGDLTATTDLAVTLYSKDVLTAPSAELERQLVSALKQLQITH